jgi:hypothetical protein
MVRKFKKDGYRPVSSANNDYIKSILKDGWEEVTKVKPKKVEKPKKVKTKQKTK